MKNYSINEIKDLYKKNFPKCKLVEKNNRKYLILKPLKIPFLKSKDCVIEVFYNSKYLRQGQLIESYRAFSKVKKFKGRKFKVLLDMYVDELQEDIKELDSLGVIVSDFKELEFLENRAGSKGLKGIEKEVYSITDNIQYNFIKSNYASCIIESEKSVIYVLEELINKTYKEKDIVVLSNKNASLSECKDRFESSDKRKNKSTN